MRSLLHVKEDCSFVLPNLLLSGVSSLVLKEIKVTVYSNRISSTRRVQMGARIKIAATQAGVTLKELAEATQTSTAMMYQYVRGNVGVPVETLKRIADVCKVELSFFDPPESPPAPKEEEAKKEEPKPAPAPTPTPAASSPEVSVLATTERIRTELRHLGALYQAYAQPKRDRSACISTLNQMIALARTVQKADQEAWALWQLGRNCMDADQLDEARRHLTAAVELFESQNMEEYQAHAQQDLAILLMRQGHLDSAQRILETLAQSPLINSRWRALHTLGVVRFQQRDYEGAIQFFIRAARQGEELTSEGEKQALMQHLMEAVTDVLRTTGHYDAALSLWLQQLERAARMRQASSFLEALLEIAQCCQSMGRIGEAKQRLELAVVLAGFLFEDDSRSGIARALLAKTLVSMGRLEEARENARIALRIANKVGGARTTMLASLAQAETSLASGQGEDALFYAQEALDEARRSARGNEVASAYEVRARAYLQQYEWSRKQGDVKAAQEFLQRAFSEANLARERAEQANQLYEHVSANITLSRCHLANGDERAAEEAAAAAVSLIEKGGIGLARLLGKDADDLPASLRSAELNLPELFADRTLALPALEWQARYLEASVLAKRLGPEAAFTALRGASEAVLTILRDFNQSEMAAYQKQTPEILRVFEMLSQCAITDGMRQEALALGQSLMRTSTEFPAVPRLN
jgi:transcriptional regulator with XRE-family HTH domain